MTSTAEYKDLEAKYYMQVVRRMPPVLVRGEGTRVFDNDDKSYLDFTAGWAVLNLGHSHPEVTKAIQDQAGKILQMSNLFYTVPQLPLAKLIVENSDVDRVFFCNSGAEANEGAAKLARKWGKVKLDGAHDGVDFGDGATKITLTLPQRSAARITLLVVSISFAGAATASTVVCVAERSTAT